MWDLCKAGIRVPNYLAGVLGVRETTCPNFSPYGSAGNRKDRPKLQTKDPNGQFKQATQSSVYQNASTCFGRKARDGTAYA